MIAGGFVAAKRPAGDLRPPELPVVHAVRGTEPVPVGIYAVVSDDGDSSQGRPRQQELRNHGTQPIRTERHPSRLLRYRSGEHHGGSES